MFKNLCLVLCFMSISSINIFSTGRKKLRFNKLNLKECRAKSIIKVSDDIYNKIRANKDSGTIEIEYKPLVNLKGRKTRISQNLLSEIVANQNTGNKIIVVDPKLLRQVKQNIFQVNQDVSQENTVYPIALRFVEPVRMDSYINSDIVLSEDILNFINRVQSINIVQGSRSLNNNSQTSDRIWPIVKRLDLSSSTFVKDINSDNIEKDTPKFSKITKISGVVLGTLGTYFVFKVFNKIKSGLRVANKLKQVSLFELKSSLTQAQMQKFEVSGINLEKFFENAKTEVKVLLDGKFLAVLNSDQLEKVHRLVHSKN